MDNTIAIPDYETAAVIARQVCAYLHHAEYMVAAPVARDAAYAALGMNTDNPRRKVIATAAATTAASKALESVNPRKAAAGPCGVCERPDVAHRCTSCGWMRA